MGTHRNPEKQAEYVIRLISGINTSRHRNKNENLLHSLNTIRNTREVCVACAKWMQETGNYQGLHKINRELAIEYLEYRSEFVVQSTLNRDRVALQHIPSLNDNRLPNIKSELGAGNLSTRSRRYTPDQIKMILERQSSLNALSTELAFRCGLRSVELITIARPIEQPTSGHRDWTKQRFSGRKGVIYTVIGKGGLCREVLVPYDLVSRLEKLRHSNPVRTVNRGIFYTQRYNISGGQSWSQSFSAASTKALGWSNGAHGCRHSYAQQRIEELQQLGFYYDDALKIVSEELGHFRTEITEVYLR